MIVLVNLRHYDRKVKTMLNKKVLVDDKNFTIHKSPSSLLNNNKKLTSFMKKNWLKQTQQLKLNWKTKNQLLRSHDIKKRTWLHRRNLHFEHPLRLPDDNCLENGWCDSHQVWEWCPAWISFSPSGSVLYHCWDVFECLGPRGQHLILHGQKSITKPISLH